MAEQSCGSGHRRDAAVGTSIEEMGPRRSPRSGGLDCDASGARICWFFTARGDRAFLMVARSGGIPRPRREGGETSVAHRRFCLGARGGVCAVARQGGAELLFFDCARRPGVLNGRATLWFW